MVNHRGFLLGENVLKIVVAVICICFLIYFLVSLYFGKINGENRKQAEATLGRISEIIKNTQTSVEEYAPPNPKGWYLFSFVEGKKPNSCTEKSCLCICDDVIDFFDRQIKECDKDGVCLIVPNLKKFEAIQIKGGELTILSIKKQDGIVEIQKNESR